MDAMMNVLQLIKIVGLAIIGIAAMCTIIAAFGGVLEKECSSLLTSFFKNKRKSWQQKVISDKISLSKEIFYDYRRNKKSKYRSVKK